MIRFVKEKKIKNKIIRFDIPRYFNGYMSEYKKLYEEITLKMEDMISCGINTFFVPCYSYKDIQYPINNFILVYIYSLFRMDHKYRNISIYICYDNKYLLDIYKTTFNSLIQNREFYKKGVIGLFESKTIIRDVKVRSSEFFFLFYFPNSNRTKKIIRRITDQEGNKVVKEFSLIPQNKYQFNYYPEFIQVLPLRGTINISFSKSDFSILKKNRIRICFSPVCFYS